MYEREFISKINLSEAMIRNYERMARESGRELIDYDEINFLVANIEEEKEEKIEQLKQERDIAEIMPVLTDKGVFDVDQKALLRINGAITALSESGGSIEWTLADNTETEVTANDLVNVIRALAAQSNAVHVKYRELASRVREATSYNDFINVNWDDEE